MKVLPGSATVRAAAGKDAMHVDLPPSRSHIQDHAPVPDAQSRFRSPGEFAEASGRGGVLGKLTDRAQNAAPDRRVEPGDVSLGSPAVSERPATIGGGIPPCLRSISSWET